MIDFIRFRLNRLKEKLWVRPLLMCVISIAVVMLAKAADATALAEHLPRVSPESLDALLTTLITSMMVIATFAVGSMVAAYASAGQRATPRTFPIMIADDVSQNALSTFIGAFIFSVVAIAFQKNEYYGIAGRFVLFVLTCLVFAIVIMTFVRWVDRIARLGRVTETIDKVEKVTSKALRRRRREPTLGGKALDEQHTPADVPTDAPPDSPPDALAVFTESYGYVQRIEIKALQQFAEDAGVTVRVAALPGAFIAPGRPIAHVTADEGDADEVDIDPVRRAFLIGDGRTFDDDPRFGLIVLSEIAAKALSPAVNDPGTAIDVIGTLVRLFATWAGPDHDDTHADNEPCECDRVLVPRLDVRDMFDDAFTAIARDGAATVEVMIKLQKALHALTTLDDPAVREAARAHARLALARAEEAMTLKHDLETVRELSAFAKRD